MCATNRRRRPVPEGERGAPAGPGTEAEPLLVVASVRRPHGLAGEVAVDISTDFPDRFAPGARLTWRRGGDLRPLTIESARPHGRRWLLRFAEASGRDASAALVGGELCVARREAIPPPHDSEYHYSHAVEGWACEDSNGRALGRVEALEETPAGPMLTVRTPEERSVLVPFVRPIVVSVEPDARRIVVDPPAGLWEL